MDDLYIFDTNKEKLKNSFYLIKNKLNELNLEINNKSGIYNLNEGIKFLGYTYYIKNNKLIIKYTNNTIKKIDRKLYKDNFNYYYKSFMSYNGYFCKVNTNLYKNKYNKKFKSKIEKYYFIKEKYPNYIIFIKYKNRYYTYNDDLKYIKTLIKTKYNNFNECRYNKIIKKLNKYILLEGNNIIIIDI